MRIELEKAFGNCKFQQQCSCNSRDSFEIESAILFYLFDEGGVSNKPVRVVNNPTNSQCIIRNPTKSEITLVKLDKCLIDNNSSKCECLLFNAHRLFFVEIKSSSPGTRANKRKKAREQLGSTITLLRNKQIDFSAYRTKAIICFKNTEPRITNASVNTARATFNQQFQVELAEQNYIDF